MAIGLIPHYSVAFPVEGLTAEQFLALAARAAKNLNWELSDSGSDGFIAYTPFRKRSVNEKIQLHVDGGLVSLKSESTGGQFVDWGRNKRNIDAFILNYDNLRSSLSTEELNVLSAEHAQNQVFNESGEPPDKRRVDAGHKTKGILSLIVPVKGYCVTPVIIDLNILVFILMMMAGVNFMLPDTQSLLGWGANFRPYTLDGQAWRLLTNCFLHIGIIHLLFNMYALLYIGILLEPRLGSWRFGIAYIITGLLASINSTYWHPMTVSAGASGAIFGMYGVFLAMLTTNLIEKSIRKALLTSIAVFVGYILLNGLKGGIDNAAHLGGLISGIIIGYSFYPGLTKTENKKLSYGLPSLLMVILLGFSFWIYNRIPNDVVRYDEQMKSFAGMESQALEIFKMPASTSREKLMNEIKDRSLYYWTEDKNLVIAADKLDLPDEIHKKDVLLIRYCDLRIASYQLIYKSIAEDTRAYDDQIRNYNDSIGSLIKTLK
ncbi:MAG: rhomboid family intramembrane serine protease [Bacteroidota bacterium]|nr:rhomboid family intramembrane serine protease [Bacteroidota bacterium]